MARTAATQLQQQIEEVRREGLPPATPRRCKRSGKLRRVRRPKPKALPRRRGVGAVRERLHRQRSPIASAVPVAPAVPQGPARRPQRGTNARLIEEILQALAPRAVRPAEIRKALQDKGVAMAFASIRHALDQLAARNAAEQVGDSNRGDAS
jgi:hypothetical protein